MNDDTTGPATPDVNDAERLALEIRKLAHDVNNALMPLMMGLSVLRKKVADPSLDRTLTNMEKGAQRVGDLTNEILALAHRHSPRPSQTEPE
ncbi:MAG: hypothetical protein HYU52_16900 [Acidobacteria bacterium]|nr:hypothetical protein [Acidobacteriota bacterium]